LGVSIGIRKTMIEEKDIEIHREKQGEGGRWIRMRLKGILEEPLDTWGMADYSGEDDEENGRGDTRFQLYNGHETRQDSW